MTVLACFSGAIGSGKSSVSTAVANELGWARAGFGDFLRAEVSRSGADAGSREILQDLGQRLVETNAEDFCRAVLASEGFNAMNNFILDGVRHVDIFYILRRIAAPASVRLVFLAADEQHRTTRIAHRTDHDDFARASSHRVESELSLDLPALADTIIDATQVFDRVVAECVSQIRLWAA